MELCNNNNIFFSFVTHFKSSSSTTSRELRQQFAACSGLDQNSQLFIYPISGSQLFPDVRSQLHVIISHIHTAILLDAINDKNII